LIARLFSPHLDQGFPGSCEIKLTIELIDQTLLCLWTAEVDAACPVSLTNHTYWNLETQKAEHQQENVHSVIDNHHLRVLLPSIAKLSEQGLPTGDFENNLIWSEGQNKRLKDVVLDDYFVDL
jgi:aldose 1-epimerase